MHQEDSGTGITGAAAGGWLVWGGRATEEALLGLGVGLGLEALHLQWSPLAQGGRQPWVWAGGGAGAPLLALHQEF